MSKSYARTKKKFISTAVGSFIGIMAAIPVAMGIYNPGIIAGATQEQNADSSAKVSGIPADFAQFAYAYSQGYAAKATSTATGSSATAGSACAESTVSTGDSGQVLGDSTSKPQADLGGVINSYNEYKSFVYNSSTSMITNTNSNNTVGSNNTTKTDIEVKDSEKLSIDVDNKTDATNIATDNSFNNESYNTKTETENVAVTKVEDSYNTKTENVAVNKVDGSYNTATKTETTSVDVDKTETNEATFNSDSNNTTTTTVGDIKDNELEIETDLSNPFPKN